MHIFVNFGYLDPGTGSMVIQSVVGIVAGVGIFGRRVFNGIGHKVKNLFSRSGSGNSSEKP